MSDLVCPDCGNASFEATLTTRTEYTYNVDSEAGLLEVAETVVDGGDLDEIETVRCTDCGADWYLPCDPVASVGGGMLVTREDYDHTQDYEPDFEGIMEARLASREPAGDTW